MFTFIDISLFLLVAIIFTRSQFIRSTRSNTNTNTSSPPAMMPFMMNPRGRGMIPSRRAPLVPPQDRHDEPQLPAFDKSFEATPTDVLKVKMILSKASQLPLELVDMILDCAEYWVCSSAVVDHADHPGQIISIGARPGQDRFLLRTKPLGLDKWLPSNGGLWRSEAIPKQLEKEYTQSELNKFVREPISALEHPFRKVVFDIVSHDQGWSSDHPNQGTFRGSCTWFDAGLDRFDAENECEQECSDRYGPLYHEETPDDVGKATHDSEAKGDFDEATDSRDDATDHKDDVTDHEREDMIPTCAIRPIWPEPADNQGSPYNVRYHHELLPNPRHLIQRNKHASSTFHHHHIEWSCNDDIDPDSPEADELEEAGRGKGTGNGEFVRNLKFGDMVTVWGHARFPGWRNDVSKVQIKVYWAL
ncbi:hypothetical protein F4804DRAFT_308418 [Jackrogersella minutella]|nr:hypothetical protein F4804DRAFT_308418 [Jackrogersella minutella]